MASLIFNPMLNAWARGNIDFDSDTFKVMLVTSGYTPDKDTHDFRNDVTNEVVGTGYTAGGAACTVTVNAVDTANDREEITLGGASWTTSTITARGAVYYKSRGGASSADEIIAYIDFGGDVSSSGGTFTLTDSTLRVQN
jgi:hypothetical protein